MRYCSMMLGVFYALAVAYIFVDKGDLSMFFMIVLNMFFFIFIVSSHYFLFRGVADTTQHIYQRAFLLIVQAALVISSLYYFYGVMYVPPFDAMGGMVFMIVPVYSYVVLGMAHLLARLVHMAWGRLK